MNEPILTVDGISKIRTGQLALEDAEAAAGGAGIVVCSSDDEELVNISDRVLVITDGRVTAELSDANLTVDQTTAAPLRPSVKEAV